MVWHALGLGLVRAMLPALLAHVAVGLLARGLVSGMACFSLGRQLVQGAAGVLASGLVRLSQWYPML